MADRKIQVFLYGATMNLDALADAGLKKRAFAPGMLLGFDLIIQPVANLVENGDGIVFGILANFTHPEMEQLLGNHIGKYTKAEYLPEPVLIRTRGGKIVPALTYMSTDLKPGFAEADYIDLIAGPAKKYGFPKWYLERIDAFKPEK